MLRRRNLLKAVSAVPVLAGASLLASPPASAQLGRPRRRVAVLGGGVAGMSAAHELIERGFEVTVFESKAIAGGKARSMGATGTGTLGRPDLPGEHGFRFFPGFYRHLPDTMARIPYRGRLTVADNLVSATRLHVAQVGKTDFIAPIVVPRTLGDIFAAINALFGSVSLGLTPDEIAYFSNRLQVWLTSCDERRMGDYEHRAWWDFCGAASRSPAYQKILATGLTRNLVAARADLISARTCAAVLTQLILNALGQGASVDRVLTGPTNEVWIDPWLAYLRSRGVTYQLGARAVEFDFDGRTIRGVTIEENGVRRKIDADYYVAAMPVEVMRRLVTPAMAAADPKLGTLDQLRTEWMNGIQLYFDRDVPIVNGHTNYYDSPWSLTSISQKQFWKDVDLSRFGDGTVRGIVSVDISSWDTPGMLYGKPANRCTPDEIRDEVVAQLRAHFDPDVDASFAAARLVAYHLDPSISYPSPGQAANDEPLLVNTAGSWRYRPDAVTRIGNLFLAADYVRTNTDLATMEGANEAARRAVNGILDASGTFAWRCGVWPLVEPPLFELSRAHDKVRHALGLPNLYA